MFGDFSNYLWTFKHILPKRISKPKNKPGCVWFTEGLSKVRKVVDLLYNIFKRINLKVDRKRYMEAKRLSRADCSAAKKAVYS